MTTNCAFLKCKRENDLIWLGVPLCLSHWGWVCSNKERALKRFKIIQIKEELIVEKKVELVEAEAIKALETENAIEVATEATIIPTTAVAADKVKRERYNDELDKRILELDSLKKSVTEIAKEVGRSYASTMYRLRKLREEAKVETVPVIENPTV